MSVRKYVLTMAMILAFALPPSVSQAAYTWPTITPTSGGNGDGSSQSFGAVINWNSGDAAITSIGAYAYINIGGPSTINVTYTPNIGSLQATISGNVTFDPALSSGDQYTIVIMASTGMSFYSTTITLNVP